MSLRKPFALFLMVLAAVCFAVPVSAQYDRARSVVVSCEYENMVPGQTQQLSARVFPEDTALQRVSWKSSNSSVAIVDNTGLVRALRAGNTWITATAADGSKTSGNVKITVSDAKVKSIEIKADYTDIVIGESIQFGAVILPDYAANRTLDWKSSNPNIASVSSNGLVTGKNLGTAMITAAAKDGSGTAGRIRINVVDLKAQIVLQADRSKIYVDDVIRLYPKLIITQNGRTSETTDSLRIDNSNSLVASIDENMVLTGLSEGETIVTVISDRYQTPAQQIAISVRERPILVMVSDHPITVSCDEHPSNISAFSGEQIQLYGFIEDASVSEGSCGDPLPAAQDQTLRWYSTAPDVADVDGTGLVSVKSAGSATIVAERPNTGLAASLRIDVKDISFSVDSIKISTGDRYRIASYLSAAEDLNVEWISLDKAIASVNESGLVRGISAGETYVYISVDGHELPDAKVRIIVEETVPDLTEEPFSPAYPTPVPTEFPAAGGEPSDLHFSELVELLALFSSSEGEY
ncbi:MAG: Ig-like domain-containing protein [Anaerolineaceae bacterium]|nr:Ig-like domain-containing protein [Anaerolineaceae bacterium]